jgi:hypothetical protein
MGLAELARERQALEELGVVPVLIHQASEAQASALLPRFHLEDLPRVSDPDRRLYRALEVPERGLWQVLGPAAIWGGLKAVLRGHGVGKVRGSLLQLPGAALVRNGAIEAVYRSRHSADLPSYLQLVRNWLA